MGWRCWPGLFAWGPPSQGLWGTQRREWEPLNQHCAGHSDRRRPAGGGHMSGGGWVCLCVCPCAHMLTRGSFQVEVLWVKTVAHLEAVFAVTGGVESRGGSGLGNQPQSLGRSQAICTLSVSACCLEGRVSPGGASVRLASGCSCVGFPVPPPKTWCPSLLPCFD